MGWIAVHERERRPVSINSGQSRTHADRPRGFGRRRLPRYIGEGIQRGERAQQPRAEPLEPRLVEQDGAPRNRDFVGIILHPLHELCRAVVLPDATDAGSAT